MKKASRLSRCLEVGIIIVFSAYAILVLWQIINASLYVPLILGIAFAVYLLLEKNDDIKTKLFYFILFLSSLSTAIVASVVKLPK